MTKLRSFRPVSMAVGLLLLVVLTVACASSKEPAAAPAPAPTTPTPAAAPAPAAPAPAAPAAAPAPAPAPAAAASTGTGASATAGAEVKATAIGLDALLKYPEGQPIVAGGPPFFPNKLVKEKGIQRLYNYHQTKFPLWTKASYGGELRSATAWNPALTLNLPGVISLNRPTYSGMLLLIDMGLCSMVGREGDYSKCKGEYARNDSIVLIPGVFQKWEQTNPTTYVFTVRKGVLWPAIPPMQRTDREVTSQDIVWFLETTKREGNLRDNFRLVQAFEAPDRYTVKVTMQRPHAEFLRNMAHTSMGMFPRECFEEKGCLGGKLISPGPFLLKESVARQRAVFERNPEFHLAGLPYVDRIVLVNVPDANAQKAALVTRQFDLVPGSLPNPSEADGIVKQAPDVQVQAVTVISGTMVLRPQLTGPLANIRVRRAMAMTMDLPTSWEASYEGFSHFNYLVSRDYFGADWYYTADQAGEWYQFNPTKAKELLKDAGYPDGFSLVIQTGTASGGRYDQMVYLQSQWKKHLGLDVKIQTVDAVTNNTLLVESKWTNLIYQAGWNTSFWSDGDLAMGQFTKGHAYNLQKIDDPKAAEWYRASESELDPAKRRAILWQFEQYELGQIYLFRLGALTGNLVKQPWELNGSGHQVAWFTALNGPTWLGMIDVNKQPRR